jgi:hypothetical protein
MTAIQGEKIRLPRKIRCLLGRKSVCLPENPGSKEKRFECTKYLSLKKVDS